MNDPIITAPDLTAANEALAKMAEQIRGLKMFNAEEIRSIKDQAWKQGYEACRSGEQAHSPYRRTVEK